MQQKKIAALDEANARLVKELSRLGDKLERTTKLAAVARQGRTYSVVGLINEQSSFLLVAKPVGQQNGLEIGHIMVWTFGGRTEIL